MGIILKANNISKQYRLGLIGTGTISHDLNRWWAGIRGKEDPYLKVGSVNDRSAKASSNYVWALQDVNFEVKKGEVLGIIGKNGAGKSTLLKILSRVTIPTTGEIKSRGRIASLLEVGTGFHPELTGLENIYLNGAILGMTKEEIKKKQHEIIEFSGCQMYIDTPVKRYSSGMRVRLAFAVAAFLEPDILVVDEVLAVGDAEFQKKAVGKMQDISKSDGRTVLFVSHNMTAVKSLCTRALVLEHGKIVFEGETDDAVDFYLKERVLSDKIDYRRLSSSKIEIKSIIVFAKNKSVEKPIYMDDIVVLKVDFLKNSSENIGLNIRIKDDAENFLFTHGSLNDFDNSKDLGELSYEIEMPKNLFNQGEFLVDFGCVIGKSFHFIEENLFSFIINPKDKMIGSYMGKSKGAFKLELNWKKC
ncbi:ABC transporter ATP-binding protein [Psychroserpens sp. MEBiC05023]